MNVFYRIAKEMSSMSDVNRINIGAVLIKGKGIISSGYAKSKTHPYQAQMNQRREKYKHRCSFLHAEFAAITSCSVHDLSGSELYIYRETMDGEIGMCRPCAACMGLIKEKGIKTIHYTTRDGFVTEKLKFPK